MPNIETQGLSQDYSVATGSFDPIIRGEVSKSELFEILKKVSRLNTPTGDDNCPPTVNTAFGGDYFSCFYGDEDCIRCPDSNHEVMTPEEALEIMCGEMSFAEFDASKGHAEKFSTVVDPSAKKSNKVFLVLAIVAVIVAAVVFSS